MVSLCCEYGQKPLVFFYFSEVRDAAWSSDLGLLAGWDSWLLRWICCKNHGEQAVGGWWVRESGLRGPTVGDGKWWEEAATKTEIWHNTDERKALLVWQFLIFLCFPLRLNTFRHNDCLTLGVVRRMCPIHPFDSRRTSAIWSSRRCGTQGLKGGSCIML